ncbi:MAG: putative rane protein [Actinomycetota bacterium]|nr:putative rane protein [Actinomycetota bacterium]
MTATASPWAWHAHPDVWAVMGALLVGYVVARRHWAPSPDELQVQRRKAVWFALGLLALEAASDWPIHDISERYLLSVHMVQHLIITFVAPPLLLLGLPAAVLRGLLRPRFVHWSFTRLARPLPAALLFNTVIAVSHWPPLVDWAVPREPAHFAVHVVLFTTATLMWFPVINRLPEYPSIGDPGRMIYLFLQSVIPTVPASFLTFGDSPLYHYYAKVPRPFHITLIADQQMAGGVMKVVGGGLIWSIIAVMFFRWYARSERERRGVLTWADVERQLHDVPAPPAPTTTDVGGPVERP